MPQNKKNVSTIKWKKNFRKIPDKITNKIKGFSKNEVIISCVKRILMQDIVNGTYAHLGMRIESDKLQFNERVIPNPLVGHYSNYNLYGQEIVRKDLPKTTQTFTWESPNWGGWGTHTCSGDREVYQRDILPPLESEIIIELVDADPIQGAFLIKFSVSEVLDTKSKSFESECFRAVNLLQENVGCVDIFPSDTKISEYLKTLYVDWEILPPGEKDDIVAKIMSGYKSKSKEIESKISGRYDLLAKMKPIKWINGTSGFRRYFGAQFSDSLVAFENIDYGNAIYLMFGNWESLSKMSRIQLLANNNGEDFCRIVHNPGWENKLEAVIKAKLKPKNKTLEWR